MTGTTQIKNRLRSVELSKQLAGAMKTVSATKYAKLNRMFSTFRNYAEESGRFISKCDDIKFSPDAESDNTRKCFVILGHNREQCGGYNSALFSFADKLIDRERDPLLLVSGRMTISHYNERNTDIAEAFVLPDIPSFDDTRELLNTILSYYKSGKVSEVWIIQQNYVNTLVQNPTIKRFLPFDSDKTVPDTSVSDNTLIYLPDKESVLLRMWQQAVEDTFYSAILEAAVGAQAATLSAMRTAYDNAIETAYKLRRMINKQRQDAITSEVIEISSGTLNNEEEYSW